MSALETYTPNPGPQKSFHESSAKFRLLLGAWGSGKSYGAIWEDIMLALEYPGSFGVIYRKTYPALRDTTKRDYLMVCPPELIAHEIKSEGREAVEFVNGSTTIFRCLDDFRKLGSTQFDRVTVDEAWEISLEEFRTLAFGRLRGKIGPRRMVLASNPPNRDNWMHDFFIRDASEDTAVFHLSTYDNKEHLPADYIARLEKMPEQWRRKFLHGEWGVLVTGTPVFSNFRTDLHVVKEARPIPTVPLMRGWDFGFHHPACVVIQVAPTGHAVVLWEKLGRDQDLRSFLTECLEEHERLFPLNPWEDYCDIAGAQANAQGMSALAKGSGAGTKDGRDRIPSAVQVMRDEFKLRPRFRRMFIHQSIEQLRRMLSTLTGAKPLLQISSLCPLHIDAYSGGYVIDTERIEEQGSRGAAPDMRKELPKKDGYYDHLIDCDRAVLAHTALHAERSPYEGKPLPDTWRARA